MTAAQVIASELTRQSGKHLLLLSGGSAVSLETCSCLADELTHHDIELEFGLVDERFDPDAHHKNGNAHAIEHVTAFKNYLESSQSKFHTILNGTGCDADSRAYGELLESKLADGYKISAITGAGEDMHTAGIFPNSEAAKNQTDSVVCYDSDDSISTRITIAPKFFENLEHVFVFLKGGSKKSILKFLDTERQHFPHDVVSYPILNIFRSTHQTVITDQEL